jgi:hypothetical protein
MIAVLYLLSEIPIPNLFWPQLAYWAVMLAAGGLAVFAFILLSLGWRQWTVRERVQLLLLALFL